MLLTKQSASCCHSFCHVGESHASCHGEQVSLVMTGLGLGMSQSDLFGCHEN
jgi:hypothetical protein